jgi:hypothetical protein
MIKEQYKYFEQEVIYQRALEFEMSSQGIDYLEAYDLVSNKKIKVIQESNESQFRQ